MLPDVWRAIRTERITGVEADRSDERVYPAGAVAGNVVGFLNRDGEGLAGLERALDEQLSGVDGTYRYERGAGGQEIPGGAREQTPAQPGAGRAHHAAAATCSGRPRRRSTGRSPRTGRGRPAR